MALATAMTISGTCFAFASNEYSRTIDMGDSWMTSYISEDDYVASAN